MWELPSRPRRDDGSHIRAIGLGETWGVAGKSGQKRRKQAKAQLRRNALARPLERPDRFQHAERRGCSRRTVFIAVLILLAVALVIPAFVGVGLVGRSVPSPTQQPGGGARLVPNDATTSDTRVVTPPPQ